MTRMLLTAERLERAARLGTMPDRWTDPQQAFFDSDFRLTVLRGSNGMGKSLALAKLGEKAIAGELHWQRGRRGPYTVILCGNTWSQLSSTVAYLMQGRLRGWLKERIRFEGGELKGQRTKIFDIVRGPGAGGVLRLGIFKAENLAGPRADVVISDEPLPEKVYNELWPRLLGRDGRMYMGFTVTAGTATKVDYLWEMVDNPAIPWVGEIVADLTLANITPRGGLVELPFMSQREIDEFEASLSQVERDMRMGRTRYPRSDLNWYDTFDPQAMVVDRPISDLNRWLVGVGVDHGVKPGSQRAQLWATTGLGSRARVHGIDEYAPEGRSGTKEDARGILDMLDRNGIALQDVDHWVGDRRHPGDWRMGKKSNQLLRSALAELTGFKSQGHGWASKLPLPLRRMNTPRKYDQSVFESATIIRDMQQSGRFTLSNRMVRLAEAMDQWNGSLKADDPWKHNIDAMHYIVVPMTNAAAA